MTDIIYAWPHLETATFYQEFQFDAANLGFDGNIKSNLTLQIVIAYSPTGVGSYPFTPQEQTYADNFQLSMLLDTSKAPYMFLPNCFIHETIDQYCPSFLYFCFYYFYLFSSHSNNNLGHILPTYKLTMCLFHKHCGIGILALPRSPTPSILAC